MTVSDDVFDAALSDGAYRRGRAHYQGEKSRLGRRAGLYYAAAWSFPGIDVVLLAGHCKESQAQAGTNYPSRLRSVHTRPVGLDYVAAAHCKPRRI